MLNTVDHGILRRCGLQGNFLDWFNAYLENRTQVVIILVTPLDCNVPQGSILTPLLYLMNAPLGESLRKHELTIHLYTDSKSVHTTF